jgi:lysophospholipase L1-like esterase
MKRLFFVISVILSLFLVELSLQIYYTVFTNYDVEMWRYANLVKMKVDDGRLHFHRPYARETIMGAEVIINSKGLRDSEHSYEKEKGTYRILSVGDSFTFGFGVKQPLVFSNLLENHLNETKPLKRISRYEVINGGVGNYTTNQELAFLENEGYKYNPDHIILNFYINDAEKEQHFQSPGFFTKYSYLNLFLKSLHYKLTSYFDESEDYVSFYSKFYYEENWNRYEKTVKQFIAASKRINAKLTVVILPDLRDLNNSPFLIIHDKIKKLYNVHGIEVIDTSYKFTDKECKYCYWVADDDPHPNELAHKLITEGIVEGLTL